MQGYLNLRKEVSPISKNPKKSYQIYVENHGEKLTCAVSRIRCGEIKFNAEGTRIKINGLDTLHPTVTMGDDKSSETVYYDFNF